jgi:hypothetical protein
MNVFSCTQLPYQPKCPSLTREERTGYALIALGVLTVAISVLALIGASNPSSQLALFGKITQRGAAALLGVGAAIATIGIYFLCSKKSVQPSGAKKKSFKKKTQKLVNKKSKELSDHDALIKLKKELKLSADPKAQVETVSGLIQPKDYCDKIYTQKTVGSVEGRKLGKNLDSKFYLVRTPDNGDSYYYAFAAGVLYKAVESYGAVSLFSHVFASFEKDANFKAMTFRDFTSKLLENKISNGGIEGRIKILKNTLENQYVMKKIAAEFRLMAVKLVYSQRGQYEKLYKYLCASGEVKVVKTFEDYLNLVSEPGFPAQFPEREQLERVADVNLYHAPHPRALHLPAIEDDDRNLEGHLVIHMLKRGAHYDALIPNLK